MERLFALEPWEVIDPDIGETRPLDQPVQPLGLTLYICSDRKCRHVDFFAYCVDRANPRR